MTQIQRGPSARSQSRETCGLIAQVVEIRERQGIESRSTISASYKNKFVRVFDPRQRTQEQRINKAEHRRVRPDAQGEGEHGHRGEAGVLQQLAKGEFEIIHNAMPASDRHSSRGARGCSSRGGQRYTGKRKRPQKRRGQEG